MKRYSTTLIVMITICMLSVALVLATNRSQQQENVPARQKAQERQEQRDKEQVPIADYSPSEISTDRNTDLSSNQNLAKREAKNRRYDNRNNIMELSEGIERSSDFIHWFQGIPSIPMAESDVIVTGQVQGANAFLSKDKGQVYSEFTITIQDILKNDARNPLNPTTPVVMEREGGAVRFPSGRVQKYRINAQGMPQIGKMYVFFLKRNSTDDDFFILTGYELRDGQIYPLDPLNTFEKHSGEQASDFLDNIRKATK